MLPKRKEEGLSKGIFDSLQKSRESMYLISMKWNTTQMEQ